MGTKIVVEGPSALVYWATGFTPQDSVMFVLVDLETGNLQVQERSLPIWIWSASESATKPPFMDGAWRFVSWCQPWQLALVSVFLDGSVESSEVELAGDDYFFPKANFLGDGGQAGYQAVGYNQQTWIKQIINEGVIVQSFPIPISPEYQGYEFVKGDTIIAFNAVNFQQGMIKTALVGNSGTVVVVDFNCTAPFSLSWAICHLGDDRFGLVRVFEDSLLFNSVGGEDNWSSTVGPYNGRPDGACKSELRSDNAGGAWVAWEESYPDNPLRSRLWLNHLPSPESNIIKERSGMTAPGGIWGSAYPNPFNSATNVVISLSRPEELHVKVFDMQGREVAQLADGQFVVGQHQFTLDGSKLSSGSYFVKMESASVIQTQRIILMK